jgi:hypothetical protein
MIEEDGLFLDRVAKSHSNPGTVSGRKRRLQPLPSVVRRLANAGAFAYAFEACRLTRLRN